MVPRNFVIINHSVPLAIKNMGKKCLLMYIFVNSDITIVFASLDSVLKRIPSASEYNKEIEII